MRKLPQTRPNADIWGIDFLGLNRHKMPHDGLNAPRRGNGASVRASASVQASARVKASAEPTAEHSAKIVAGTVENPPRPGTAVAENTPRPAVSVSAGTGGGGKIDPHRGAASSGNSPRNGAGNGVGASVGKIRPRPSSPREQLPPQVGPIQRPQ
ncbi:hypothetical protein [Dactylosporangium sp. CS-033363]|uniref:hypothetical protein n=1 Tax=Dactylosporangium sp. CS-033363 TaxID=3239935 RepID=UPI003D8BD24A